MSLFILTTSGSPRLIQSRDGGLLINKDIISLTSTPLFSNSALLGILGLVSRTAPIKVSESEKELLQTLSTLLSDKLAMVKADQDIEYMAYYDQLTGLPNRQLFNERAAQGITLSKRNESYLGFVLINLNSFKLVNNTLGHTYGDKLIIDISDTLKRTLRKSDTIARFGRGRIYHPPQ